MEKNQKIDFKKLLEETALENLISKDEVQKIFIETINKIIHEIDVEAEIEVIFEDNNITIFNKKYSLVEASTYKELNEKHYIMARTCYIPIDEALKNPKIYGVIKKEDFNDFDFLEKPIDITDHFFKNTKKFKPIFNQRIIQEKKAKIYASFKDSVGKKVKAIVINSDQNRVVLKLEENPTIELIMYRGNFDTNINYFTNNVIEVTIDEVLEESKNIQILAKNISLDEIYEQIKEIIPEYREGIIEIMGIAREPDYKTKIAVKSNVASINAIGTMIGTRGSRINSIREIFNNERVELVNWKSDKKDFIMEALLPSETIYIKEESHDVFLVIVPDIRQTLAIGRRGANVKLCAKLTRSKINIVSISQAQEQGIDFVWNGNLSKNDLKSIEEGKKEQKFGNFTNSRKNNSINNKEMNDYFEKENANFNEAFYNYNEDEFENQDENIEQEKNNEILEKINDSDFYISDDDLEKLNKDFDDFES